MTAPKLDIHDSRDDTSDEAEPLSRLNWWATRTFVAYLLIAFPVLLALGRYHWFFADEWEFLANRSVSFNDLFRHHFGHWVTTPVLTYRALYSIFGLTSYLPYQAVLVASHLLSSWLLFVIMRRCHVRAWIAACAAAPFVIFGPGAMNIVWAFQIAFSFTVALGLTQLVLALHDGPIDRRDWLALGAGAVALSCSGVAPSMVVAVGVAVLIRRGWRPAALQTAPLAAMYITWYVLAKPETRGSAPTIEQLRAWVSEGVVSAFGALGHFTVVSAALAAMLAVGFVLTLISHDTNTNRTRVAAPVGLLVGGLAFLTASGVARASGTIGEGAASARFVYIAGGLALPALAMSAEALVERWRMTGPGVALVFLVAIVPNIDGFESKPWNGNFFDQRRSLLTTLGYSPYVDEAPEWVRLDPGLFLFQELDVGFLRSARDDGHLPEPPDQPDPALEPLLPLRFGLAQIDEAMPRAATCTVYNQPLHVVTRLGDRFWLSSPINVAVSNGTRALSRSVPLSPANGALVEATLPDLTIAFHPAQAGGTIRLCEGNRAAPP